MNYDLPKTDCLLVIRCNAFLNQKEFRDLQKYIYDSRERFQTILLPPYCEALVVPKDVEINFDPAHEHDYDHDNQFLCNPDQNSETDVESG